MEEANIKLRKTTSDLRKAEGLARIISDISADTIITCDDSGNITSLNPAVRKMFGYDPQELLGECFKKLLPLISNREDSLVETKGRRKDATEFPAEIQIGKANHEKQNILVLSVRDITERKLQYNLLEKLVEERTLELKHSNRRVIDILESITDGFFAFDKNWQFTYVNKEAEGLVAKSSEDLLGKSFPKLIRYFLNKWKLPIKIKQLDEGFSVYFRDISQRKKDEEEIRLSQERFFKIFNASPDLIAIQSQKDMCYIDANNIWLASIGYTKEEILGKTVSELNLDKDQRTVKIFENLAKHKSLQSEKIILGLLQLLDRKDQRDEYKSYYNIMIEELER